jgi:polyisoprenoid-binding protein YceI
MFDGIKVMRFERDVASNQLNCDRHDACSLKARKRLTREIIAMAQSWKIDPTHSAIHFTVRHMVFAKVRGSFGSWSAELTLDPDDLSRSELTVEIDAASIDTAVADRDTHLRSGDFLDAERHPKLSFRSTGIEKSSDTELRLTGDLTIRGTTRPVTLEVERLGEGVDPWGGRRVGFSARTTINRKDFGLTWNQALEAGGVLVGEKVEIEIDVEAVAS